MIKEYQINDILNAVDSIYKIERKEDKSVKINNKSDTSNELTPNNGEKANKRDVLVLDQMVE